jgi:hypothetical protein
MSKPDREGAMDGFRRPKLPLTGSCPCGAVRYEVSQPPLFVYACHCTTCQRVSGSAFTLGLPIWAESFRIVAGKPTDWTRRNSKGVMTSAWFCAHCSGRIYGQTEGRDAILILRGGTLDDTGWIRLTAHYWAGEAQPWERFEDGAEVFEGQPADGRSLAARFRAMWDAAAE